MYLLFFEGQGDDTNMHFEDFNEIPGTLKQETQLGTAQLKPMSHLLCTQYNCQY